MTLSAGKVRHLLVSFLHLSDSEFVTKLRRLVYPETEKCNLTLATSIISLVAKWMGKAWCLRRSLNKALQNTHFCSRGNYYKTLVTVQKNLN